MNGNNNFIDIAKYGVVTVAIAAICFIVYQFNNIVQNQLTHSQEIMAEIRLTVQDNNTVIKQNTEVLKEVKILLQNNNK